MEFLVFDDFLANLNFQGLGFKNLIFRVQGLGFKNSIFRVQDFFESIVQPIFGILMDFLAKFCIFDEFLAIFQKIENFRVQGLRIQNQGLGFKNSIF